MPKQIAPRDCAYCVRETGDKDAERVLFDHQPGGVAVLCQECGARGPLIEGVDRAAAAWNTFQIGYGKV